MKVKENITVETWDYDYEPNFYEEEESLAAHFDAMMDKRGEMLNLLEKESHEHV